MTNKKKKWTMNNNFLKVFSLLLAIICWFIVAITSPASIIKDIKEVPIEVHNQEAALAQLGLNIIEMETTSVTAQVKGDRLTLGQLDPEQLAATIQLSLSNSEAGVYELRIVPTEATNNTLGIQNNAYEILGYSPEKIKVKLDRIETITLPIEVEISGDVSVPDGYIREKNEVITPSEIHVSGPQYELDKIHGAVIELEINQALDKNYVKEADIKLVDPEGNTLDPDEHHLTLDNTTAQVMIPILKKKSLPLEVELLSPPRNFPREQLAYRMSNYEVSVAGPVETAEKHKELLLGFIDLSQVNIENSSFVFDVELPSGFVNLDNIRTVTVTFDSATWAQETFAVENIRIVNPPDNFDVRVITDKIYNVTFVGDSEIIRDLRSEDIIAEVDLADKKELTLGQYQYPVKISAPTKGLAWATEVDGEYTVVIQVTEHN